MTKLYHRDIAMPAGALTDFCNRQWNLAYTRHALQEALSDKLGTLTHAPRSIRFTDADVIEIEREEITGHPYFRTSKIVVRVPYDERRDLVLVLRKFIDGAAIVITLWTNNVGDTHSTLDRKKYATA